MIIVTASRDVPADLPGRIARGEHPRVTYLELARELEASLVDYGEARRLAGPLAAVLERGGLLTLPLAWAVARREGVRAIVTDGERVGLPLALLLRHRGRRRPAHAMVAHALSAPKKLPFLDVLEAHRGIDRFLVYAGFQRDFIAERWAIPPERVVLTPFCVDQRFFAPERARPSDGPPLVFSSGLERRDYPTLIEAVRGLDARVAISVASPWSRQRDSTAGRALPANVTVARLPGYEEVRQRYADSRVVVVPLQDVDFQAGVTVILEAMAMGKPVVATRTRGRTDAVVHGETGLLVPPGDPEALRAAIERLLGDADEAAAMGRAGRRRLEEGGLTIDRYVGRVAEVVRGMIEAPVLSRWR